MSAVIVLTPILTPIIIASWPVVTGAVAAAAAAMGFAMTKSVAEQVKAQTTTSHHEHSVEIELQESQGTQETIATNQEIVVAKGGVELRIVRDARGRCKVCAKGIGKTDAELRQIAKEFSERMTQNFMYNKVMTELKRKGFQVVNEETMNDESVRINVRRWED